MNTFEILKELEKEFIAFFPRNREDIFRTEKMFF